MPRKQKLLQKKLQQMSGWSDDELVQHSEMMLLAAQEQNNLSSHTKHCLREVAHVVYALRERARDAELVLQRER